MAPDTVHVIYASPFMQMRLPSVWFLEKSILACTRAASRNTQSPLWNSSLKKTGLDPSGCGNYKTIPKITVNCWARREHSPQPVRWDKTEVVKKSQSGFWQRHKTVWLHCKGCFEIVWRWRVFHPCTTDAVFWWGWTSGSITGTTSFVVYRIYVLPLCPHYPAS